MEGNPPIEAPAVERPLREALRHAAAALAHNEVPFAVAGSWALWCHGAPEPEHDVDLVIAADDAEAAASALADAGFRVERTPEDWLFKAWLGEAMVDVLHGQRGVPLDRADIAQGERRQLFGVWMPVLPATVVMTAKLQSLDEHTCDFSALLPVARAVREQLDWASIERDTRDNPYAASFLDLLRRLEVAPTGGR